MFQSCIPVKQRLTDAILSALFGPAALKPQGFQMLERKMEKAQNKSENTAKPLNRLLLNWHPPSQTFQSG